MPITNFPGPGDDKPVSLANSQWELFPVGEATQLQQDWPGIWSAGGNIRGNRQWELLAPMARERRGPQTPAEEEAVRLREAWVARHRGDFQLPGVVAQIKWLAVGDRGLEHMRQVIQEAKDKMRERRHLHAQLVGKRAATADEALLVQKDGEGEEYGMAGPEVFTFVITNGQKDRQAEIVDPNGWDFTAYESNPVVLDGHQAESVMDILGKGLPPLRRVGDDWQLDIVLSSCHKGRMARTLILEGALRTVSVGFVSLQRERDADGTLVHRKAELLEVSLVPIPANPAAVLVGAKAAIASQKLPVDLASSWDGTMAEQSVRRWASSDGSGDPATIDWSKYRQAFLWVDESKPELFGSYKLGVCNVQDGQLTLVAAGLATAAQVLGGARGGVNIPDADRPGVMEALAQYQQQVADARDAAAQQEQMAADQPAAMPEEMDKKAGRVISRQNEDVLRQARDMAVGLIEALDQLLAQVPGDAPQVIPGDTPEMIGDAMGGGQPQQKLHDSLATLLRAVMEG